MFFFADTAPVLRHLRTSASEQLGKSGVHNASQETDWLLCHALNCSQAQLLARLELSVSEHEFKALDGLFHRRSNGEPLQYILKSAPFWGRIFEVGSGTLIPRPETELLIELALKLLGKDDITFLDWGTGSGCIAATLLLEIPNSRAFLAEKNPLSLCCAWRNLKNFNLLDRAMLIHSRTPEDLPVHGECDLVISNPPYIPSRVIPTLMREVRDYEPHLALDGGLDGMDCYFKLFVQAPHWLRKGGLLLLEMGDEAQVERLKAEVKNNFILISEARDFSGNLRCTAWQWNP